MKLFLGALIAVLLAAGMLGVLAYLRLQDAEQVRAAVVAAERARAQQIEAQNPEPALDTRADLRELQERFDALQAKHDLVLERLRELEEGQTDQPQPLPYASFPEAVAYWKALLADEDTDLSELERLQAMIAQPELVEFLLTDIELDADLREFAASALAELDEETQARIMDSIFADHGLEEELGRVRIALIGVMSGLEDPASLRHLPQLSALIDSQTEPGLDHYAAIVLAAHDGLAADTAFELLAESESAWVRESLPVLEALHRPHVDHGAFVISATVDGHLLPGDAVVECNGERIGGWKELDRLVAGTDAGTQLALVVVDVNGAWQTRQVPGRADLRCLRRDL